MAYATIALIVGIFYAFFASGGLHFILISLDRENFNFMKTLLMEMLDYLKFKFWFDFEMQTILPVISIIAICLFLGFSIYLAGFAIASFLMFSLILCHVYYRQDYRYLDLNWQSAVQLANRGVEPGRKC